MSSAYLNSQVIAATVTGSLALLGTLVVFFLSRNRKPKHYSYHRRVTRDNHDRLTYAGYEELLKQTAEELRRMYAIAKDRELLISKLRKENAELYEKIRTQDEEITRLRHIREYKEAALKISA